jgi:hypothetical protein
MRNCSGKWEKNTQQISRQSICMIPHKDDLMKQYAYLWLSVLVMAMTLTSCELVEGIFKAGFWTAIILIVLVVGLILWLVGRGRR